MKRKRINRLAICSSDNYHNSKKLHSDYLQEKHSHFCGVTVSGEIKIDTPIVKGNTITPKFKTFRTFGKEMRVTIDEYNTYCKELGL